MDLVLDTDAGRRLEAYFGAIGELPSALARNDPGLLARNDPPRARVTPA